MKKTIVLFLSLALILVLAACGGKSTETTSGGASESNTSDSAASTDNSKSPNDDKISTGKTLVVYFSASGNTESVAKSISALTKADMFEIEPENAYTDEDLDWTNSSSRVNREHDDESLRRVELKTAAVPDWESYDTVFIGYPIWWGIAAWPTESFVTANDFTGKTVIPFCTSASSGLGQSAELLAEKAKGGDWSEGHRFSSGASEDTVKEWVDSLNLKK